MASLKDIKRHITAVKQTQKLTKAMNMVAAAKLRATQNRTELFRFYADEHARLMEEIGRRIHEIEHPLLDGNDDSKKALILLFTSDRGLCGSFNSNLLNHLDNRIVSLREEGLDPELFIVGRKGCDYYKRRDIAVKEEIKGEIGLFDYERAQFITKQMMDYHKGKEYNKIYICYTSFLSLTRHKPNVEQLLPLLPDDVKALSSSDQLDYIIEPDASTLLARLVPRSLTIMVYRAFLESITSENAARMQAMENASKSCKDIIGNLTMAYNKARQAAVTS
ncbi:MAG: ATP synthase F1 subunit gamma, partial [Deltaproteobacteria bacterium]|nr:ATP synthase F1 subunit gamma [Deltaproteobacteria bacterium]